MSGQQQMSSTLKERLKKSGRFHAGKSAHTRFIPPATQRADELVQPSLTQDVDGCSTPKRMQGKSLGKDQGIKKRKIHLPEKTDSFDFLSNQNDIVSEDQGNSTCDNTADKKAEDAVDQFKGLSPLICSKKVNYDSASHTSCERQESSNQIERLKQKKMLLEKDLLEKKEKLRKLKMVERYREKNNLTDLDVTISKWRDVSQRALRDLLDLHPEPKPSMAELLTQLQIDSNLVHYDFDEEGFV